MAKYFKDRIVFVGATDLILKDVFPLPTFYASGSGELIRPVIPGVELHATAAAMFLDGDYIRPPKMYITLWCMFGLTLFSAAWTEIAREHISRFSRVLQEHWHKRRRFRRFRFRIQDSVWFGLYGLVALLPPYLYWRACVYFFVEQNRWVVATYPIVSSVIASGVVLIFLFTIESAERRKVIFQMGLYMDKDIMEEVLAHPEGEYVKTRRTAATVMFTDLEGFTSYSELHDPRDVVAALNSFMTRMKPIIKRYGGTVDKFIGDAIMAYFGVPLERYDHAERALACAIELQEECVRFRLETGIDFKMRIGIHTGEVIAGSVGAEGTTSDEPFFNYTVIGDTVNLASRLEGKNKEFGSWIMCSADTYLIAPDVVEVLPARAAIKGKSKEVEVYIVRGMKGHEPRDIAWGGALNFAMLDPSLADAERERALLSRGPHELESSVPELPALPAPESVEEELALESSRDHLE
jgi:class 3 adenylate cyclase